MIRNLERIKADYSRMWNTSRQQIAEGKIKVDPVPDNSSRRWGVSVVIRPTGKLLDNLADTAKNLSQYTGSDQVIYDASTIHTTIRSIEFHRTEVKNDDPLVQKYITALKSVTANSKPIKISYRGLTADKTSIMAQGWPEDDALQDLREAFDKELEKENLITGPEENNLRQTSHVSLVVFTRDLPTPEKVVEYIDDHRNTEYGTDTIDEVELIRYRRTSSGVELIKLASMPLGTYDK